MNHEGAVRLSLAFVLVLEGLSFISGYVKASVTLYLSNDETTAYDYLTREMAKATAPYEIWNTIALGAELLVVLLLIMSVATLHSTTKQAFHRVAVYGALVAFLAKWGAYALYDNLVTQAVGRLKLESGLLSTANEVQARFVAAWGFWGSQAYDSLTVLLSLIFLVLLAFAVWELYMEKVVSVWPSMQPTVGTVEPLAPIAMPASAQTNAPSAEAKQAETKFCRYCGARIIRDSKFCEECGTKLT
jgi:ribosomal protein L40E